MSSANDKAPAAAAASGGGAPKKDPKTKLPPGMVLGPDGKPCKICTAFRYWKPPKSNPDSTASSSQRPSFSKGAAASSSFESVTGVMAALANGSSTSNLTTPPRPDEPPEGCPPDVEQLGRATWTFLHTTAAYFPEQPTPVQRTRMRGLLLALPTLYPCSHCASHLGERMQAHPPPDLSGGEGEGRVALSRWLCERHNEVNARLGKPNFDCSIESTDSRWKDGPSDGRCD